MRTRLTSSLMWEGEINNRADRFFIQR